MFNYSLTADIPLPITPAPDAGVHIISFNSGYDRTVNTVPVHEWKDDEGNVEATLLRINDNSKDPFVIQFADGVDFRIAYTSAQKTQVSYHRSDSVSDDLLRHLILDQMVPRIIAAQGGLCLHGSAVEQRGSAFLFTGPSGSGKSTLANYLAQTGSRFVSDDCLYIDPVNNLIFPGSPVSRLNSDSTGLLYTDADQVQTASGKHHIVFEPGNTALPIAGIFLLQDGGSVSIEPASSAAAVMKLIEQTFALDVTDKRWIRDNFARTEQLVQHTPLYCLTTNRSPESLPAIAHMLDELP